MENQDLTWNGSCQAETIYGPGPTETNGPSIKRQRVDGMIETSLGNAESQITLSQGAEGIVTRIKYLGRDAVRKERVPKRYRHPVLDQKLRMRRLAQEARVLLRLRKACVPVPAVYDVDTRRITLIMQYMHGITLKAYLCCSGSTSTEGVMRAVGHEVARMHSADIIHGDLTTGNVIVDTTSTKMNISLIDFGLSYGNGTEEDMAVDLYVFERAVISTHSEQARRLNNAFLQTYGQTLQRPAVMSRLEDVRARGRKRDMTG